MQKRRKFSPEFKRGAVEQACQPDVSCAQVARELGINANLLSRWKRAAETEGHLAFGGSGNPRDEEVAALPGQQSEPGILDGVGVLELVHQNMLEPLLVMGE
mgnify:CR=1 FL=1